MRAVITNHPSLRRAVPVVWHDCSWLPRIRVQSSSFPCAVISDPLPARGNVSFLKTMKTNSARPRHSRAGFTLVELLVVIAIIGILAGMVLAVLPGVVNSAKRAKSKIEAQDIVTAINAYDSAYGRFPVSKNAQTAAGTNDLTYGGSVLLNAGFTGYATTNNDEVIAILTDVVTNVVTGQGVNGNHVKNPQRTVFLNAKHVDDATLPGIGPDGVYRDPWGQPYIISLDLNFDEQCQDVFYAQKAVSQQAGQTGINGLFNPDAGGNTDNFQFHGKVMVWSAGPDKKISNTDPADKIPNKDNVISW